MRQTLAIVFALALSACATVPPEDMLANAEPLTRTEANGDVVTEYRVGDRLQMVKVVPFRGPTYYIYDRNGDGVVNDADANGGPMTYYTLFSW